MVAAEEGHGARRRLGSMCKSGLGTEPQDAQRGVPGEGPEADDDRGVEQLELAGGVGEAGVAFGWGGLVLRRGAANGGGDPGSGEAEAVLAVARERLVRQTRAVKRGEEEIARAVAGEEAAGRLAPWAAGARPRMTILAAGSPKPGRGRPQ